MCLPEVDQERDHIIGAPTARVTLVEYGDFECPFCRQASPMVRILRSHFGDGLRFVYRHFPQPQAHPHALSAAEAAEAAGAQGRFWEYHDLLFDNAPRLQTESLIAYGSRLGLDMRRFEAELAGHTHLARIEKQLADGLQLGLRATPTFFVNGLMADVSFGYSALHGAVERAGASLRPASRTRGHASR